MTLKSVGQAIAPFNLLKESFSQVAPIYLPLLVIASASIPFSIIINTQPQPLPPAAGLGILAYLLIIAPIISGIAIHFICRYLKQGTMDLSGALNQTLRQSAQLIAGMVMYFVAVVLGFICLLIPGIYLSLKWGFFPYAIISENCSAIEGLKYSSQLTKGRWWRVFGSQLVGMLPLLLGTVIAGIFGFMLGRMGVSPFISVVVGSIVGTIFTPFLNLFLVKLFFRLQETTDFQPQA